MDPNWKFDYPHTLAMTDVKASSPHSSHCPQWRRAFTWMAARSERITRRYVCGLLFTVQRLSLGWTLAA